MYIYIYIYIFKYIHATVLGKWPHMSFLSFLRCLLLVHLLPLTKYRSDIALLLAMKLAV